ncbi:MAG: TMEM165/GDT1 family protein [Firmicutes bacterium]|nr:TMEM165/GDT1 family protein [Bacillota bacterium]
MNLKTLFVTFGLIFLAELGDKTQLTTMMLAAQTRSPLSVFLGASLALDLALDCGAVLGGFITNFIPVRYIHMAAGVAFILLGTLLLTGKM